METMEQQLTLVADRTAQIISNAKYNIKAFSISDTLQATIQGNYSTNAYGSYLFCASMNAAVDNIMDISNLVTNGYIHTFDDKIYYIKEDSISYTPTPEQCRHYEEIAQKKGRIIIGPPMDSSGKSAFNFSKSIIDIDSGRYLGLLTMDLREELFYNVYSSLSENGKQLFFLTDENHTVLSSQDRALCQQPLPFSVSSETEIIDYQNTRYLMMQVPVDETGFSIYSLLPYSTVMQEAVSLGALVSVIGLLMILGTILLSHILSRSLVRPLEQLSVYAREVGKGNLDAALSIRSEDEIGALAEEFTNSVQNIKYLTTKIYTEQTHKKEYALNLLQAQINPHFLYNCLDNISTLVESGENKTADQMLHYLGRYYRLILSKGRNIITIEEELQLITDYMQIQLLRTPDLFTYEIDIDPSIVEYKTLKFLLQPIVENSIMHGFYGYRKDGHISIKGQVEDGTIRISVTDNGKGFSTNSNEEILSPLENTIPQHFGLRNIHERIQLKYGPDYGIQIFSIPKEGTTITLRFPKIL